MRKILITSLCAILGLAAHAQTISYSNVGVQVTGEDINIDFDIMAKDMRMPCNGQVILEFAVENADRRMVLPMVIYAGSMRSKYEERRRILSDTHSAEIYHNFNKLKKRGNTDLHYHMEVPFQTWMTNGDLTVREYVHDCDGEKLTYSGVLAHIGEGGEVHFRVLEKVVEPEPEPVVETESIVEVVQQTVDWQEREPEWEMPVVEDSTKLRTVTISLPYSFERGHMTVRTDMLDNFIELQRIDRLFTSLHDKEIIDVSICGYSSPEGGYARNVELADGRCNNFKKYLAERFPIDAVRYAQVGWIAEDWAGLEMAVEKSNISQKEEVLSVIRNRRFDYDQREEALKQIYPWSSVYRVLLDEIFPQLRRIEVTVSYIEEE